MTFIQTCTYVDHYQDPGGSPVLRLFGSTRLGRKCLCHVHGFFPYFYCEALDATEEALRIVLRKVGKRVHAVTKMQGLMSMFGFNPNPNEDLFKIELCDPGDVKQCAEALQAAGGCRTFNAHLGYVLQFLVDCDVRGMEEIILNRFTFRGPIWGTPREEEDWTQAKAVKMNLVQTVQPPKGQLFDTWWASFKRPMRTSTVDLELDVHVGDISVRVNVPKPGSLASKNVKYVRSLVSWWDAEEHRRWKSKVNDELDSGEFESDVASGSFSQEPAQIASAMSSTTSSQRNVKDDDPMGYRARLKRLIETLSVQKKSPEAKTTSMGIEASQDTLELVNLLESWNKSPHDFEDAKQDMMAMTTMGISPSQMSDEALLEEPASGSAAAAAAVMQTTLPMLPRPRFDTGSPIMGKRNRRALLSDASSSDDIDEEQDQEEDDSSLDDECEHDRGMWRDIAASQREMEERNEDEELDGGGGGSDVVFGERDPHSKKTKYVVPASSLPPSNAFLFGKADLDPIHNINLFYSNAKDVPARLRTELDTNEKNFAAPKLYSDSVIPAPGVVNRSLHQALPHVGGGGGSARATTSTTRWVEPRAAAPYPPKITSFTTQASTQASNLVSSAFSPATPAGDPSLGGRKKKLRTAFERGPENNHFTTLVVEVLAQSRSSAPDVKYADQGKPFSLIPDPDKDPLLAIFYCIRNEDTAEDDCAGMIYIGTPAVAGDDDGSVTSTSPAPNHSFLSSNSLLTKRKCVSSESVLLRSFVDLTRHVDPDVIMGWEVQKDSLGYIMHRAKILGDLNVVRNLSRVPFGTQDRRHDNDAWGATEHSGFWLPGRHIFNVWRLCREALKLSSYTLGNVLEKLTGDKLARFSNRVLCDWWSSKSTQYMVCEHFCDRVLSVHRVVNHLNILGRSAELARLYGMDFFSILSRGSQYRVEAVMARVAKTLNFVLFSPTRKQVAKQRAMECTPLIFEPESRFYASPVVVLDFRSLYPSVMIAHNMCFSTCLGKMKTGGPTLRGNSNFSNQTSEDVAKEFEQGLGVDATYLPSDDCFSSFDKIGFVSPNGVVFASKRERLGVLPRMLQEILEARIMIKKSVIGNDADEGKKRVAEARQFGLKMIANVTYGYCASSFSGRMPCAEIADAIVQTGRSALESAIRMVKDEFPGAECVYGDTDSLFVHLPGKSLNEARVIGAEISRRVTKSLPKPMMLQFEKVYFPCVLEVKKRYVGLKFPAEAPKQRKQNDDDQEEVGTLDAKGIEMVRRDGCPAVVKAMESSLKEMFSSRDLSKVKSVLMKQFDDMFDGSASISDFILTGKVKLGSYAKDRKGRGNYPPAAVVADKMLKRDSRSKPLFKERISYLVVCGPKGSRLVDLVVDPHEFFAKGLQLNVPHYVNKAIIPALDRLLCVAGVDVAQWFRESRPLYTTMAKWRRPMTTNGSHSIERYFPTTPCVLCSAPTRSAGGRARNLVLICETCSCDMQRARYSADCAARWMEVQATRALRVCGDCICTVPSNRLASSRAGMFCLNLDCEDFFTRKKHQERVFADFYGLRSVGDFTNTGAMSSKGRDRENIVVLE